MDENINIGGRLHSTATGNVVAGADEILDDTTGKKQSEINTETYRLVENINESLENLNPEQTEALSVAEKTNNNEVKLGYFECETESNIAAKIITNATGYILSKGGSIKIKMINANTASNVTLNINSTGAKTLYYSGKLTSPTNTWENNEIIEVYYDGNNYYANNIESGGVFATKEKVKNISIDDKPIAESNNLVKSGGIYLIRKDLTQVIGDEEYTIQLSQFTEQNGFIANGIWRVDFGKHIVIPITYGRQYTLIAGAKNTGYTFLKSYITPIVGSTPDYATDYDNVVAINANTSANFIAPIDAKYLYILTKVDESRMPSSLVANSMPNKFQGALSDIELIKEDIENVEDFDTNVFNKNLNLSDYTENIGLLSNGIWRTDIGKHIIIPVIPLRSYNIIASSKNTGYSFFKTYNTPTSGGTPDYATGYEREISVAANTSSGRIKVPLDAHYMYVLTMVDESRMPSSIIRYGKTEDLSNKTLEDAKDYTDSSLTEAKEYTDSAIEELTDEGITESLLDGTRQVNNIINVVGLSQFKLVKMQIQEPNGYCCWPFIGKLQNRLVCLYSVVNGHEATIGHINARLSANGIIWTPNRLIINHTNQRDNITGKGNDSNGNLLFWNRVGFMDNTTYYELYKTTDGINFDIISTPTFDEIVQPTDILYVPTVGLMSFYHVYGTTRKWGVLISGDNGLTWTKIQIGSGTSADCPTEIYGAYIGDGKILAIGRFDNYSVSNPRLWQIQSSDYGSNWTIIATNVAGAGNTASLIYNETNDKVSLLLYNRGTGNFEYREDTIDNVWDNPTNWPMPTIVTQGTIGQDAGNVNSVLYNGSIVASFYSGDSINTGIYVVII